MSAKLLLTNDPPPRRHGLGVLVSALTGLGLGVAVGLVGAELLGDVDGGRVRAAVRRMRPGTDPDEEAGPDQLEYEVLRALRSNTETRRLDLRVRGLPGGMVEITGTAPDERTRSLVRKVARAVPGADVVVNRVLVEGVDYPGSPPGSTSQAK